MSEPQTPQKTPDELDKEFAAKIPGTLKEDIGDTFSRVLSDDPTIKIPATRSFMALIQTAMVICGDARYDKLIAFHRRQAINAIDFYAKENWAGAVELCYKVQEDLGFLVYNGYGTSKGKSFAIPAKQSAAPAPDGRR